MCCEILRKMWYVLKKEKVNKKKITKDPSERKVVLMIDVNRKG